MKLIIAGSRHLSLDVETIDKVIKSLDIKVTEVVSGGARGVDASGEKWAKENNIKVTQFNPDWHLGLKAGPIRNQKMAAYGDVLVAFLIDSKFGESKGTKNMINQMKKLEKPTYIYQQESL